MAHSTGKTMVLNKVDFVNSGAYSCEVIADLTFHTLIETKHMLVIGKSIYHIPLQLNMIIFRNVGL